ncbi:MAG TPA: S8 family serine peptidase [Steroidobacteraceae bacterium]|nr:S8 family serine peptidase [Steroidobacteraceae bacterium]
MRALQKSSLSIAGILFAVLGSAGQPREWRSHVSADVLKLYGAPASTEALAGASASAGAIGNHARFDAQGRLQIDVKYECVLGAPLPALRGAGLIVGTVVAATPFCVVEGWSALRAIPAVAGVAGVTRVELPHYAARRRPALGAAARSSLPAAGLHASPQSGNSPAIDGEGVTLMHADQFISQTSVNGSGVHIAVMSDDVTSLATIQGRGELPAVDVVQPSSNATPNPDPTDEGTMMLEEVHAVAPGASLAFCAPLTSVEYLACLQTLITAGASIVVDDIAYIGEDVMSAQSEMATGIANLLSANPSLALFTVTENYNGSYWQGPYAPVSTASQFNLTSLSCGSQTDYYVNSFAGAGGEAVGVLASGTYPGLFQWADPYGANASNFDVYLIDVTSSSGTCLSAAGSTDTYMDLTQAWNVSDQYALYIATPDQSLAGKYLKLLIGGDGATTLSTSTPGSVVSPQAFVAGVNLVGAVNGSDNIGDTIEPFSGLGPIQLELPAPLQIQAPLMVAPDAIYVDSASTDFAVPANGLFYGTSAAAPNAAAVAALLRAAFPSLTPSELTAALQSGAAALGSATPNSTFGYGRVDAVGALQSIPGPQISGFSSASITGGTSSSSLPVTVNGTGALRLSVSPAALIPADSSGVELAPSNCGNGASVCSLVLTPAIGQSGTTTVTLTVTDGANRSASMQAQVTVLKPAPPTVSLTSGGSQSVDVNTSIAPVTFNLTGTGPLAVSSTVHDLSSVALSSGCGMSSLNCTANIGKAPSSASSASLTILVADSYGQQATATATVSVIQPGSGGGGGALGWVSVVGLAALAGLKRAGRVRNVG